MEFDFAGGDFASLMKDKGNKVLQSSVTNNDQIDTYLKTFLFNSFWSPCNIHFPDWEEEVAGRSHFNHCLITHESSTHNIEEGLGEARPCTHKACR